MRKVWDVIVVGAGPAGCISAKKCAEQGLNTLMLEKRKIPRNKVCTGMIMGPWAKEIIADEFGKIPQSILADPPCYKGIMLHVPGADSIRIENEMPVSWRKDLDYWMSEKAANAGVEIMDQSRLIYLGNARHGYEVRIKKGSDNKSLIARWIIGADGATSAVRKFIFPDLKVHYRPAFRLSYDVDLSLSRDWFHWFFPLGKSSPRFDVNYKDSVFLIEGGGIKKCRQEIEKILMGLGLPAQREPLWRDGCLVAELHDLLLDGTLVAGRDDVLLVGDAAGFFLPFTIEGIGPALKSGHLAAKAILKGAALGRKAIEPYLDEIRHLLKVLKDLVPMVLELKKSEEVGPVNLIESIAKVIERTLFVS